jgi:tRNA (guanine37-N1)-methyltransferase
MHFDILTLFPQMFDTPFEESIVKRAIIEGLISIVTHNIRDHATDKHHMTDDTPYGGGGGMVMKPEPIYQAVEAIFAEETPPSVPIILLSPQGRLFTQRIAWELAAYPRIVLICGRYEGVDERVRQFLANDEISIGDYVLTGGEIPAMVIVDAVTRLMEHPQYTRPGVFRGQSVPEVLLSGDHAAVDLWRRREALRRTYERRPDLLRKADLTEEERSFVESLHQDGD